MSDVTVVLQSTGDTVGVFQTHAVPRDGDTVVVEDDWYRVVQVIWDFNSANGRAVTLRVI